MVYLSLDKAYIAAGESFKLGLNKIAKAFEERAIKLYK